MSESATEKERFADIDTIVRLHHGDPDNLIEILHAAQQLSGWLDRDLLAYLAVRLRLPPSLVYGVASFYHAFRLTTPGHHACTVCIGTSCHIKGGTTILRELERRLAIGAGMSLPDGSLSLNSVRCLGVCESAPLVMLDGVALGGVTPTELGDEVSRRHAADDWPTGAGWPDSPEPVLPVVGYEALLSVLNTQTPEQVCAVISASGLRGRAGGGYPTGLKWELVRRAPGKRKYLVANGDEGDPGAFMDRTIMESDPHRLLEGMAIGGYATGADCGFVYVRGEYPLAARRLRRAIMEAEAAGFLGTHIRGSGFSFRIRLRIGAGAFVCGEETALMASVMGRRGQPVIRPPYPAQQGLWGYPTLINNVETFSCIAPIIRNGAAWFSSVGTPGNSGTKVFSISGDVATVGVYEVPLGTTLREILAMAGGVVGGDFKAAQTGGAGGGCIPAACLDLPIDYDSLKPIGTTMGSGGLIILNDRRCMPDLARFFMEFCLDESCGKCTPCRAGTRQAVGLLAGITAGTGRREDLARLEEICLLMRDASLCGLGMSAPNPVLGTLRWFREEYEAHLHDGRCPSGVCGMEAR